MNLDCNTSEKKVNKVYKRYKEKIDDTVNVYILVSTYDDCGEESREIVK